MIYTCQHCEKDTESKAAHSITVYQDDGVEDRNEILCSLCYSEWLQSLKG